MKIPGGNIGHSTTSTNTAKDMTPCVIDNIDRSIRSQPPVSFFKYWDQQFLKNGFVPEALKIIKNVSCFFMKNFLFGSPLFFVANLDTGIKTNPIVVSPCAK